MLPSVPCTQFFFAKTLKIMFECLFHVLLSENRPRSQPAGALAARHVLSAVAVPHILGELADGARIPGDAEFEWFSAGAFRPQAESGLP